MTVAPYFLDPSDPRAPTEEQWAAMSQAEREDVVASLPSEPACETMPEGDRHRLPKENAARALGDFFRRMGRKVYLSSELPVYYPGERYFAPDLIAVLDVEPRERAHWTVSAEGKGLDFVLEITLFGDREKDLVRNVARYARLGIPEYFILDLQGPRILGYRLTPDRPGAYQRILPQQGRWASTVLGLDLSIENDKIRFMVGNAPLLDSDELLARVSSMVDDLVAKEEALARALAEERRRAQSAEHRAETAEHRAETAEHRAESAEGRVAALAARLRALGIDPDEP